MRQKRSTISLSKTKKAYSLPQISSIELHPLLSRTPELHNPDFLVFDLDPKSASFDKVVEVAKAIHQVLTSIEIDSYPKTSGATGLHIAVPLGAPKL